MSRIEIPKTYKLYINGQFPRSERGRVLAQQDAGGSFMANYAWATRKDFRNAMVAARAAHTGWSGRTAFNRSQILYRIAETLADRRASFVDKLSIFGVDNAAKTVGKAVDDIFYYAGWADKYAQVFSSVNPVAQPFFNFSTPESTGIVTSFVSKNAPLLGLVHGLLPVILSGNTCVLIVDNIAPTLAIDFAEVIGVSDVPSGVVNILTGKRDELSSYVAGHMDLNAIYYCGDDRDEIVEIETISAENLKRTHITPDLSQSEWLNHKPTLYHIQPFIELKTAWHPIGT